MTVAVPMVLRSLRIWPWYLRRNDVESSPHRVTAASWFRWFRWFRRFTLWHALHMRCTGLVDNAASRIHHIFGHNIQQVWTSLRTAKAYSNSFRSPKYAKASTFESFDILKLLKESDYRWSHVHTHWAPRPVTTPFSCSMPKCVKHLKTPTAMKPRKKLTKQNQPEPTRTMTRTFPSQLSAEYPGALTSRCISELKTSLVKFPFVPAASGWTMHLWWLLGP